MPFVGEVAALVTSILWSGSSMCFTYAGRRVGSQPVNINRLLVALALLVLIHSVLFGTPFPFDAGPARLGWLGLSGFIGYALGDALLFESFVLIGARLAMLVMTTSPLFSTALGWVFLDQSLTVPKLAAMLVTLGGIAWVVTSGHGHDGHRHVARGVLLGLGGSLGQAVGLLFSRFGLEGGFHPISANLIRVVAGSAALVLWIALRTGLRGSLVAMRDRKAFSFVALGAIAGPVLGVVGSLFAIAHAPLGIAATLMSLSPVILLAPTHYLFGDRITLRAALGTVLALAGAGALFLF